MSGDHRLEKIQIKPHLTLRIQRSEQFKTNFIGFYFKRPLTAYEATCATLMASIMTKCSAMFLKPTDFSKALDGLYGSVLYSDVDKFGEMLSVQIKMVFPKDAHLPESIEDRSLDFIRAVLFEPAFIHQAFDPGIFEMEKKALLDAYASRKNDRVAYSYDRLIEEMCSTEAYAIHSDGEEAVLKDLTVEKIRSYYDQLMHTSDIDVIAVGHFDNELLISALASFPFPESQPVEVAFSAVQPMPQRLGYVNELDDIKQAKLNMGFRLPLNLDNQDYYATVVMSFIFGNGVNSYLFRILREKENLCYYAFARFEGFKSLLVVGSGIEALNTEKALSVIREGIAWVQKGEFSDQDLVLAKKAIVKSLESTQDSIFSLAGFIYSQLLRGNEAGLEGYKSEIAKVDRYLVMSVAQRLEADVLYLLSGEEVAL